MSAQTGLSRRRVAAASSSNDVDDDEDDVRRPPLSTTTSTASEAAAANGSRAVHAGTALAGGSRVAYDPRDLVGAAGGGGVDEEGSSPRLTLLEEILLLGIKDRAVCAHLVFCCRLVESSPRPFIC